MTDKELRLTVEEALEWEPSLDSHYIGVSVNNGVVTLTGFVSSYPEKREAEHVAARVRGVRAVAGALEVRLPGQHARTDVEIASEAASALAWNTLVPEDRVRVWVEKGRVTLEGTVDWHYQRLAADRAVRYITGVTDVNNHIELRPAVTRGAVSSQIEAALKRSAELDARRIVVETMGDHVTLWGNVESWGERVAAENAAWSCPGVAHVENNLAVGVPAKTTLPVEEFVLP
jgi:osmotically-inducible protein OsmY